MDIIEKTEIIDAVINQIKIDFQNGDLTALEELLSYLNAYTLKSYLPEDGVV